MIPSPDSKIEFLEFHQPYLEVGKYELRVDQKVQSSKFQEQTFAQKLTFVVTGERFGPLPPNDIVSVFPPEQSVGDHSNALPHIVLHRSTLPWERWPGQTDENRSWMALVLFRESDFDDAERPRVQTLTLEQLKNTAPATARFPSFELEFGQQSSDEVTVIDVQKKVLERVLPTAEELSLTAHVHQRKAADGTLEGDIDATVFCNRLPEPGGNSTVYLVSLEKRFKSGAFDYQGAGPDEWIRLVSLKSWSFFSVDPRRSFFGLMTQLNRSPGEPRLPAEDTTHRLAAPYLEQGYVPVPHRMRRGSKTVSFYRGPLLPGENRDSVSLSVKCSDELLRYDPATGMLDVSYACAWELGRMLTLANSGVALELFQWKKRSAQQEQGLSQGRARRLPLRHSRPDMTGMPERVEAWFRGLSLLVGVPFNYLIPDERLLPAEGVRFFRLDSAWVDCLLDGAFSIGSVTDADWERDRSVRARTSLRQGPREVSGFLLRSSVVPGYPKLLVEAYAERVEDPAAIPSDGHSLPALRIETLSEDVLMGLFDGALQTVDFFQEPESLGFGVDPPEDDSLIFTKNLRTRSGDSTDIIISPLPWRDQARGVLDLKALADEMSSKLKWTPFTAAQFALQMIEGGPRIRFVAGPR
ncbi:hypothetical protein DAT35_23745 [Vitiosangium sp. GDMCC 1.1324]|nr:hypothetical protein DAT35_23745 [Vitiosangium sp. GDMCC 1.1324]